MNSSDEPEKAKRVFDPGVTRVIGVCRPIRNMKGVLSAWFIKKRNQTPMNGILHYIGLEVHKDSIAVSIAPQNSTEVRRYGIIGGTLEAFEIREKPAIDACSPLDFY
jgi:hypothetical protein